MNKHTVIFYGRDIHGKGDCGTLIVHVTGAKSFTEADEAAKERFAGSRRDWIHVTSIEGHVKTCSPVLFNIERVVIPQRPNAVIPRLFDELPFEGEIITNGFTIDETYPIIGWEGENAVVSNDHGNKRSVGVDLDKSAHIKVRKHRVETAGIYTREACAGYFEPVYIDSE